MKTVRCNRADCFQNVFGVSCKLLNSPYEDPMECPFHKTDEEVENGRIEAHNKLLKLGLRGKDLIEQYEYNPYRRGMW